MKSLLIVSAILFLSACSTSPQSPAEKCASNAEEYRKNTEVITNNRTGNKAQRRDANRLFDLNIAIRNNAESDKCDVSTWPAQPERPY